ncbi:cupin-like domain-containing protein [Leptobacterium sp. I13]|uniref:cupin-like domain-containing protein n=1 Tax=Leptobacterium meishanense TaxID=3128904 RepID=UPI0030ECC867
MGYIQVNKIEKPTPEEFKERFIKNPKPVIIKDFAADWEAVNKWTFDYFKDKYGDWDVPLYDDTYHRAGKGYMKPIMHRKFSEYLEIIQKEPTNLRFHNFQVMQRAPELANDYKKPDLMKGFMKFALMFFGGEGSKLNLHYDIDCSHVFLTHFQTEKKVYLFPPSESTYLYHLPYTNHAHLDVLNPDWKKYPAFKYARGYEATINHGETLFIPKLWWHYVYYSKGGYSLALRANDSLNTKIRGAYNLVRLFTIDNTINFLLKDTWKQWKYSIAQQRANQVIKTIKT